MFKNQDLLIFGPKINNYMSNFLPLEVVCRGNETQLEWMKNYIR